MDVLKKAQHFLEQKPELSGFGDQATQNFKTSSISSSYIQKI